MSFTSKVVIVTGATSGIGEAIALAFANKQAHVVLVGRNEDKLNKVAKQCEENGITPLIIKADVSEDADCRKIISETVNRFNKIDVLVNNAGILRCGLLQTGDTLKLYDEIMKTNLRSVVNLTMLATPHLIASKGNVVNISSAGGTRVFSPISAVYCMSKAAMDHFTRGAAMELARLGVRVNSICPGPVKTNLFAAAGINKSYEEMNFPTALNRWSESGEVADIASFLASDKARGVTGSKYVVDNGALLLMP